MAEGRGTVATVYAPPPAPRGWRLDELYPGATIRYHSFGRRAFASALEALEARGKTVLLPEFICRDLLSSLAASGAKAAYYPVDQSLRPATPPERWPQSCAVVAVDYFGFPQDLAPFREYAERTGAVVIEDNAHGLFSRGESGAPLGARGDLGILSLRKTLALPNGAALLSARVVLPPQSPFDDAETSRYRAKQFARRMAGKLGPKATLLGLSLLRGARRALSGRRVPGPEPDAERRLPEPALPCRELAQPLSIGDPQREVERRRELYALIDAALRPVGAVPVFDRLPKNTSPYGYPFRAPRERMDGVLSALAALGLEPLTWPDLPDALAASAPAHYRDVKLVHFLW